MDFLELEKGDVKTAMAALRDGVRGLMKEVGPETLADALAITASDLCHAIGKKRGAADIYVLIRDEIRPLLTRASAERDFDTLCIVLWAVRLAAGRRRVLGRASA